MQEKKSCFKWGLTVFLAGCALLVFYDIFYRSGAGTLLSFVSKLISILAPVIYGFFMAYLLAPIVSAIERGVKVCLAKLQKNQVHPKSLSWGWLRGVSILLTWAVVLVLLYLLMSVLIPQLVDSVTMLINNAETYYNQIYTWITDLLDRNPQIGSWVEDNVNRYYNEALNMLTTKVLPSFQTLLTGLTGGIMTGIWSLITFLKNLLIGLIISVYLLAMKEQSVARCCKLVYGALPERKAAFAVRGVRKVDEIFSGFVRGKLLDSLIIGILCFIGCSILNIPYTPLVSVIVGITNVIPFFGPFLGAVPSAFLILLASPLKCLYFIIFIILLQQLDGNVIGPKILGESTGISSFWVVVAILVGGGLAGVPGMFFGVPIFACLQVLVRWLVNRRLTQRGMPLEAYHYTGRDRQEPQPPKADEPRS